MAPRRRTRLAPDDRRDQILGVATQVFRRSEYSAVSLDEVAAAAGVTRGLLHHYFGSKRALYLEVVRATTTIPPTTRLVPEDAIGDRDDVLAQCVSRWMALVRQVGGLWAGIDRSGGIASSDVDRVVEEARDDLVERMVAELPLPDDLDRDVLRSALRAYAAFARVTTEEWLVRRALDRDQTHAILTTTLIALIDDVVPQTPSGSSSPIPSRSASSSSSAAESSGRGPRTST